MDTNQLHDLISLQLEQSETTDYSELLLKLYSMLMCHQIDSIASLNLIISKCIRLLRSKNIDHDSNHVMATSTINFPRMEELIRYHGRL